MSDLSLQKFSDRLDAAAADGTLTPDQVRLAKAALEGGGMQAAIEALQASDVANAVNHMESHEELRHEAAVGLDAASGNITENTAEDLASLRDALNEDLASGEALALIQKIAAATVGRMKLDADPQP